MIAWFVMTIAVVWVASVEAVVVHTSVEVVVAVAPVEVRVAIITHAVVLVRQIAIVIVIVDIVNGGKYVMGVLGGKTLGQKRK